MAEGRAPHPSQIFSGMWAHPWLFPGFEPLASGPTSLTNRSRRNGASNPVQLVGDYTNPILKPEAAERVKKFAKCRWTITASRTRATNVGRTDSPFVLSSNGMEILKSRERSP